MLFFGLFRPSRFCHAWLLRYRRIVVNHKKYFLTNLTRFGIRRSCLNTILPATPSGATSKTDSIESSDVSVSAVSSFRDSVSASNVETISMRTRRRRFAITVARNYGMKCIVMRCESNSERGDQCGNPAKYPPRAPRLCWLHNRYGDRNAMLQAPSGPVENMYREKFLELLILVDGATK